MPWYRIIVHGRNVLTKIGDQVRYMGFFRPMETSAHDSDEAIQKALTECAEDIRQKPNVISDADVTIEADEVEPIAAPSTDKMGFAWYHQNESQGTS